MNAHLPAGTNFEGRFLVEKLLGEGGMGAVYLAEQPLVGRHVAIKILQASVMSNNDAERFLREAKILKLLVHKDIVQVFYCGVSVSKQCYMVMEYIKGRSLRETLNERSRFPLEEALSLFIQLCDAISYAHQQGIVHRDIKPQNILLTDDAQQVKVIDFGLAIIDSAKQKLTATGALVGSVGYMSPEQCQGLRADARADIYSVAAVLYECITGKAPFEADNAIGVMYKQINEVAPSIKNDLPADQRLDALELVLQKAMVADREKRFQNIASLRKYLQLISDGRQDEVFEQLSGDNKRVDYTVKDLRKSKLLLIPLFFLAFVGSIFLWRVTKVKTEEFQLLKGNKTNYTEALIGDAELSQMPWPRAEFLVSRMKGEKKIVDFLLRWLSFHREMVSARYERDAIGLVVDNLVRQGDLKGANSFLGTVLYKPSKKMTIDGSNMLKLVEQKLDMDMHDSNAALQLKDVHIIEELLRTGQVGLIDKYDAYESLLIHFMAIHDYASSVKWIKKAEALARTSNSLDLLWRPPYLFAREALAEEKLGHPVQVNAALKNCESSIKVADEAILVQNKIRMIDRVLNTLLGMETCKIERLELCTNCFRDGLEFGDEIPNFQRAWLLQNISNLSLLIWMEKFSADTAGSGEFALKRNDHRQLDKFIFELNESVQLYRPLVEQNRSAPHWIQEHRSNEAALHQPTLYVFNSQGRYSNTDAPPELGETISFRYLHSLAWLSALELIAGKQRDAEEHLSVAISIKSLASNQEATISVARCLKNYALAWNNAGLKPEAALIFHEALKLYSAYPKMYSDEVLQIQSCLQTLDTNHALKSGSGSGRKS